MLSVFLIEFNEVLDCQESCNKRSVDSGLVAEFPLVSFFGG